METIKGDQVTMGVHALILQMIIFLQQHVFTKESTPA